jgi:predicted MFS family arabinose efflux permease
VSDLFCETTANFSHSAGVEAILNSKMYLEFDKNHGSSTYQRFLLTPKLFVFFYSASLGCLLPFLPIFFRLNGMSAIQTGLLVSTRYLIIFWSATTLSFLASKINARKCVLVMAVLFGALANMAFVFTAKYQEKTGQNCADNPDIGENVNQSLVTNFGPSIFNHANINTNNSIHFQAMFNVSIEQDIFDAIGLKFDKQFLTFLVIVAVSTFMSSPAKPLHELVSLAIIKEHNASYNIQRLCSVLGWSVMSLLVAVVVYKLPCSFKLSQNVFDLHFGFHILFATTALIFIVIMKAPAHKVTAKFKFCRVLKVACKNPNCLVAIVAMAILGTAQSVVSSYLFWYIQDLGGNEIHMGLILFVSGLSQIPLLFLTKYLIHWLGHGWMFFISMFGFATRFMLYSYINHPLMVIPIELLHALTSSSIWLTSMSLAVLVAPIGFERSMQNLFTTSYYGLGMGVGGVLASIGYQLYGPIQVFECAAAVCAVYSLVMALLQCLISPPDENHGFPINGDYYKAGAGSNNQSDWLLEALNAEEEEIQYSRS